MKKSIWAVTIILSIVLMVGCSSNSANSSKGKEELTFGASFNTMNNPHWINWSEGLAEIIEAKGDKLILMDAQDDISKQVADVEDLVTQQVDVIFIAPADSKGIKPALESAQAANIPVIIMDVPVKDENLVTATISTDNVMAGKILAEAMIKEMGGKAEIGVIDYSTVNAVVDRTDGFEEVIKNSPNMRIIGRQEGMGTTDLGMQVMESFMQSNPEINAVFAVNDLSALGASSAVEAAKRTDIKIFGIDGSQDGFKAVKQGKIVGTSAQFPHKMGTIAANTAYKVLAGEKVEKLTEVPPVWVNKSNVDQFLK